MAKSKDGLRPRRPSLHPAPSNMGERVPVPCEGGVMTVCKTEINSGHPVVWESSTLGWGLQHHVVSPQVRTEGCPLEGSPSTCAPSVTPTRSVCPSMPGMRRTWAGVTRVRPQPRLWDAPGTIKKSEG